MASISIIALSRKNIGIYHADSITLDTIQTASSILQDNHNRHHVFFNDRGFHNHIVHLILTQTALGASPENMRGSYEREGKYQRPSLPDNECLVQSMAYSNNFVACLSNEDNYHSFVRFFELEMQAHGTEQVVRRYLFSRSEISEHLFTRMYASFLHPLIHFGFGLEFNQPSIIAEAMAQAAVHQPEVINIFKGVRRHEGETSCVSGKRNHRLLIDLVQEIESSEEIRTAPCWGNGTFIDDDPYSSAPESLWQIVKQWCVDVSTLEDQTAEMINVCAYFVATAQMPGKEPRLDFFLIHNVNSSIFFSAFLQNDMLRPQDKAKLLEWKGRMDLVAYASRGSPKLRVDELSCYKPRHPNMSWQELFERVNDFPDDSHVSKFLRAMAHGQRLRKAYPRHMRAMPMTEELFYQAAHVAIDVAESSDASKRWVMGAGFESRWAHLPAQERADEKLNSLGENA